jgi:hypothetical protein
VSEILLASVKLRQKIGVFDVYNKFFNLTIALVWSMRALPTQRNGWAG